MAAEAWVNDNGTARQIREIWVNDNGTAHQITEIWMNDNGTARRIFAGENVMIPISSVTAVTSIPTVAEARIIFVADGDVLGTNGTNALVDRGDWVSPKLNFGNFEIRATLQSGAINSGTLNAWQSLSTSRSWMCRHDAEVLFEIRSAITSIVLASGVVTFNAEAV